MARVTAAPYYTPRDFSGMTPGSILDRELQKAVYGKIIPAPPQYSTRIDVAFQMLADFRRGYGEPLMFQLGGGSGDRYFVYLLEQHALKHMDSDWDWTECEHAALGSGEKIPEAICRCILDLIEHDKKSDAWCADMDAKKVQVAQ